MIGYGVVSSSEALVAGGSISILVAQFVIIGFVVAAYNEGQEHSNISTEVPDESVGHSALNENIETKKDN